VVFLAVALAPCLGGATEFSAVFETNANAGSGFEVWWVGFHSMNDFMLSTPYSDVWSQLDIHAEWSMGGFACDGHQYHVLLESNYDVGIGLEVWLITYESLADFYSNIQAWTGYTAHDITAGWTTHGFASDGARYYQVLEADADAGGGAEVYVVTYTSLANVISANPESGGYSQIDIASEYSIADLASDGQKFFLVLETDTDAGPYAEFYVITYASFADLMSDTQESAANPSIDLDAAWGMNGFAADLTLGGLPFADGFESGDTSAWSATVR